MGLFITITQHIRMHPLLTLYTPAPTHVIHPLLAALPYPTRLLKADLAQPRVMRYLTAQGSRIIVHTAPAYLTGWKENKVR